MKNFIGAFLFLGIFLTAANSQAQPITHPQQKLEVIHGQIQQLRQQIRQESTKLDQMKQKLLVLQQEMRHTMGAMMGGAGPGIG